MLRILFLLLIFPSVIHADVIYEKLNFTDANGREVVSLKIVKTISYDDYDEFESAINDINQNNYRVQFDSVILNSSGGNLDAALRIGKLLNKNHLSTWVLPNDSCASACSLILQSGVCKMAIGDVGVHRASPTSYDSFDEIKDSVRFSRKDVEAFLKAMDAHPSMIHMFFNVPNWNMHYLTNEEKFIFGMFNATEEEMQYRLQIASEKMGQFKDDLVDQLVEKFINEQYPAEGWDLGYFYRFPSCSEQLFLEDGLSEHVGIDIEPKPEDIFEIYDPIQGYYDEEENMTSSDVIPFKPGYAYYYGFAVYAKVKEIQFKERIKLSGPTFWGDSETGESLDDDPNYEVSEDKSMITVTRNTENIGSWFNSWELTKEDPKGEMIIEILFQDKVVHTFKFWIEEPKK